MSIRPTTRLRDAQSYFRYSPYMVEKYLALGGSSELWLAKTKRTDKMVVIKHSRFEIDCEIGRSTYLREAAMLRQLWHPGIVKILATSWEIDPSCKSQYLVLEPVAGRTVAEIVENDPVRGVEAIRLAISIAEALQYLHEMRIIHRDITTKNIMWDGSQAVLLDFGLALEARSDLPPIRQGEIQMHEFWSDEETGITNGTPSYIAPEVVKGASPDVRSDLFALGVTLFRVAAGYAPFYGDDAVELAYAVVQKPPVALASGNRTFDAIILRLLEKNPVDRFQSARELLAALHGLL